MGHTSFLEKKSKGYTSNIEMYNNMLFDVSKEYNCIFLSDLNMRMDETHYYTSDGYHLNQLGHTLLSEEIGNIICSL